jgi:hypothetical protein
MLRLRIGSVSVDSGQIIIVDPCYLRDFESNEYERDIKQIGNFSYSGSCNTTQTPERAGPLDHNDIFGHTFSAAVASSTGYGDGEYEVFATYTADDRIAKLEIIFIKGESTDV